MPSVRIFKKLNQGAYFVTFTVKNWEYILDRHGRWETLSQTIRWYQKNKGLKLYGFVFMINHIHLLIRSDNLIDFVRGFKSFSAREILKNIKMTESSVLSNFYDKNNNKYELWRKTNMPKGVENEKYFYQKLRYIHENPVRRNYVMKVEDWYWSSANESCVLRVDDVYEE